MIYYPIPQDKLPVYKGKYDSLPISDRLSSEVISLPIWPELSKEVQEEVVSALVE
jgi:dTDP-4-amino-4,6-dideoxygalactose transaminase